MKHVIALVKVEICQKEKSIVQFINRKNTKKALINRKGLQTSLSLSSSDYIFMNENLTPVNNKIAFHCRKLKRNGQIDKTYLRDGVIHIANSNIMGKQLQYYICGALRDLATCAHFKKREKHPWRNVTFSKVAS